MSNSYFDFKQFTINQDTSSFKVGTDGVLLGAYADVSDARNILDIGTGTGLIAIMLAQRSDASIVAIEPDDESYRQACGNVSKCPWSSRINVVNSDLQNYDPPEEKFDLIVSNPPYFTGSLKNPDPVKSRARHNDCLSFEDILHGSLRVLSESGTLQVILPFEAGNLFVAKASDYRLNCNNVLRIRPVYNGEVKRVILRFSKKNCNLTEKELVIEKGRRHDYTEDYINLTRDFYLNF
jgi:tRNA1Val (adenine37-N6)-methyltransferase